MPLDMTASLNQAIPGFTGNTANASKLIKELMSGRLTSGERRAIYDSGAERATMGGMPGGSAAGGSLFANADLRNIGLASGQRQQQGFQDLLSMLQGYSGTVTPTTGQELQNQQFGASQAQQDRQFQQNFGLQQNAQDLEAAKFNEQYGPKLYESYSGPPGIMNNFGAGDYSEWRDSRGRASGNANALMFRYRR